MSYEDHSFKIQLYSYFIRVRPFVIFHGEYYGLQQILTYLQNNYPQVSYASILHRFKQSIHYGFNLTKLPQNVADGLEYIGFRLVDLNFPLSWFKLEYRKGGFPVITFTRGNLVLSFEDLYPYGYSVRAVNSSYILVGEVRGETDLFMDPIVRSGDTMSITGGSEEAEIENVYWEFWNASYVNGWNLAYRNQFGVEYAFNCTLEVGDWGTETWIAAEEDQVLFFGGNDPFYVADYGHFRMGKLLDPTTKIGSRGCSLMFNLSSYGGIWGDVESSCTFYDTTFQVLQGSSNLDIYLEGNLTMYGCKFINVQGVDTTDYGSANWYDISIIENDGLYLEEPSPTLEKIKALNTTYLAYFVLSADVTLREFYGRNAQEEEWYIMAVDYDANIYLINPDVDGWVFHFQNPLSYIGEIYHQASYDLLVLYQNGSAVNGAEVMLSHYGQDYGEDYSGSTFSNGSIPTQVLTVEFYNATGGDTPYSLNPYHVEITKAAYSYSGNFTHSGKAIHTVILQEPEPEPEAPSGGPFFHGVRANYGSCILQIIGPTEVHPRFTEYLRNRVVVSYDLALQNELNRGSEFRIAYEVKAETGELLLEEEHTQDVAPGSQWLSDVEFVVPFSKSSDPHYYNLTVGLWADGRSLGDLRYQIKVAHTPLGPLLYTSALLGIVVALVCVAYGITQYWPKIRRAK